MNTFFIQSETRCGLINAYLFIQSANSRVNNEPIRYLFNGITHEMNLPIYKAFKRVHSLSWLMTAEPKGLNKINWEAIKAIGQLEDISYTGNLSTK